MSAFIRSKSKTVILWAMICCVFGGVLALYSLPLEAVLYAAALSGFFIIIFTLVDFIYFRRRLRALRRSSKEVSLSLESLPEPSNLLEREYDEMIRALYAEKNEIKTRYSKSFDEMSDYYTAWAHQVKSPITAMQLMLQNGKADADEMTEQLSSVSRYTDMVMCYIRVNSESSDLVIKEYELDGIIKQAVRKFSSVFIRKKLKLEYEPTSVCAVTDEKYLLFVIEQILSNAVKYTEAGSVSITFEDARTLCISDTGRGISPQDLPRIFEKGFTGLNGRADKRASGIGLYLCDKICKKLGHKISAESGELGTTIKIDLSRKEIMLE